MRGSGGGWEVISISIEQGFLAYDRLVSLGLTDDEACKALFEMMENRHLVHAVIDRIEGKYFGAHILADSACSLNLLLMELEEV